MNRRMKSESCKIKMTTQTRGRDCQFFDKELFGMSIYKKGKEAVEQEIVKELKMIILRSALPLLTLEAWFTRTTTG